jgi:hypothetical protein
MRIQITRASGCGQLLLSWFTFSSQVHIARRQSGCGKGYALCDSSAVRDSEVRAYEIRRSRLGPNLKIWCLSFLLVTLSACGGGGGGGDNSNGSSSSGNKEDNGSPNPSTTWVTRAICNSGSPTALARSPTRFIALNESGAPLTSSNGYDWGPLNYTGSLPRKDIVWGDGKFVAVGNYGAIATSPEGDAWTSRSNCGLMCTDKLYSVSWSGSHYVAVGDNGMIKNSSDGVEWISRTSPVTSELRDVASFGSIFVATAFDYDILKAAIIYSVDGGETWSRATIEDSTGYFLNEIVWDGTRFLATSFSGGTWSSTNGQYWTRIGGGYRSIVTPTGSGYMAANVGQIYTSDDAIEWTTHYNFSYQAIADILWLQERDEYLVVGDSYDSGLFIATSTDADEWKVHFFSEPMTGILWNGSFFLAMDKNGRFYTSDDGLSWASNKMIPYGGGGVRRRNDLAWSGERYVVASSVELHASADGLEWDRVHSYSGANFTSVIWTGNEFAAISSDAWGSSGRFFNSANGLDWGSGVEIGGTGLEDIAWSGSRYVVVGAGGNVYTSADGLTWEQQTASPTSLRSVTWSGTQFVAVGDSGTIITSADGLGWTNHSIGGGPRLNAVEWLNDAQFVAAGNGRRMFVSTNGVVWTEEATDSTRNLSALAASPQRAVAVGQLGSIISKP